MKRQSVWLEATHIVNKAGKQKTGIPYYTQNLTKALLELNSTNHYTVFGSLFFNNKLPKDFPNANYRFIRYIPGKIWNQLIKKKLLPPLNILFLNNPNIIIFFNYVRLPVLGKTKTVTVIYDLAFNHYPQFIQEKNLAYLKKFVPESIEKSDHIITISESAREDIIKSYSVDPSRVSVVECAVDHNKFYPKEVTAEVRNRYKLPQNYILFVGTLEPRKNLITLLNAYSKIESGLQDRYPLVIAGGRGWSDEELLQKLQEVKKKCNILEVGYVHDLDLPEVYAGASVFIFPSYYEGFGLPILEAMASGVPVICANNSSLSEVAGNAAILFSADDKEELKQQIKNVLGDETAQTQLKAKGIERAKQFSWEKSASKLLAILEKITG